RRWPRGSTASRPTASTVVSTVVSLLSGRYRRRHRPAVEWQIQGPAGQGAGGKPGACSDTTSAPSDVVSRTVSVPVSRQPSGPYASPVLVNVMVGYRAASRTRFDVTSLSRRGLSVRKLPASIVARAVDRAVSAAITIFPARVRSVARPGA